MIKIQKNEVYEVSGIKVSLIKDNNEFRPNSCLESKCDICCLRSKCFIDFNFIEHKNHQCYGNDYFILK